jgi:hypothetical protein
VNRILYVAGLAMLAMLLLAPTAWAQNVYNCPDFQFQEDAQAVFDATPGDPNKLDQGGIPGVACESLPHRGASPQPQAAPTPEQPKADQPADQPKADSPPDQPKAQSSADQPKAAETTQSAALPNTSGVKLSGSAVILPAATALLVGAGLLSIALMRRR